MMMQKMHSTPSGKKVYLGRKLSMPPSNPIASQDEDPGSSKIKKSYEGIKINRRKR